MLDIVYIFSWDRKYVDLTYGLTLLLFFDYLYFWSLFELVMKNSNIKHAFDFLCAKPSLLLINPDKNLSKMNNPNTFFHCLPAYKIDSNSCLLEYVLRILDPWSSFIKRQGSTTLLAIDLSKI